jgi:hypothetical protein
VGGRLARRISGVNGLNHDFLRLVSEVFSGAQSAELANSGA